MRTSIKAGLSVRAARGVATSARATSAGRGGAKAGLAALGLALLAGCATPVLTQTGLLTSYDHLAPSEATATKSRIFIDKAAMARVRTVRIVPTTFPAAVAGPTLTDKERHVVANAADRALCYELSLRYDVVSSGPADLTVRANITRAGLTNVPASGVAVGASAAITIAAQVGVGFADTIGKVPVPRLPIGLGDLTVEAEALDARRQQRAAMVWAGGANSFTNQARFSQIADIYDLAGDFGQDFGSYLATGQDPFESELTIPTYERIRVTMLGEMPRDPDCQAFGRAPGVDGIVGDSFGLPPDWTDKGATAGRP